MIVVFFATAAIFVILIVDMTPLHGPELTSYIKAFHQRNFVDEAGLARRNLDAYRADYADWLSDDLADTGFSQESILDLALDDVADAFGHRVDDVHVLAALSVTASQWREAARTCQPGDVRAAYLLLAAEIVLALLPQLFANGLADEVSARTCRDEFLNLVASGLDMDSPTDADIERFIEAHRAEVIDLVSLGAGEPRPLPSLVHFDGDDAEGAEL